MKSPSLQTIAAQDLMRQHFKPRDFVVPGILPEGLTLLAGKPKIGKSWLSLALSSAVAGGLDFLGKPVRSCGSVLYLALEDGPARLQHRLKLLLDGGRPPKDLAFATSCPTLDQGGSDAIAAWVRTADRPRLVVVDVFQRVRPKRVGGDRLYEDDYSAALPLKRIADENGIAIVCVTHTRKGEAADDPLDQVSGTSGLTGAADNILLLDRNQKGTTLYGRGRDSEEFELALRFDPRRGLWTALGDRADVERSDSRNAILKAVRDSGNPLTPKEIAERCGVDHDTTKKLVRRMTEAGDLTPIGKGKYSTSVPFVPLVPPIPTSSPLSSVPPIPPMDEEKEERRGNAGNRGNGSGYPMHAQPAAGARQARPALECGGDRS